MATGLKHEEIPEFTVVQVTYFPRHGHKRLITFVKQEGTWRVPGDEYLSLRNDYALKETYPNYRVVARPV